MSSKYSIYLADKKCGGGDHKIEWYHASLILVDNVSAKTVQEINFRNTKKSMRMQPTVMNEARGMAYMHNEFELAEMLHGDEAVMLSAWNHMLKYAVHVHQGNVIYDDNFIDLGDENTINCRAGVSAALATIGIIVQAGVSKEDIGIHGRQRMPLGVLFLMSSTPSQSLNALRADKQNLSALLTEDTWQHAEKYQLGAGWN